MQRRHDLGMLIAIFTFFLAGTEKGKAGPYLGMLIAIFTFFLAGTEKGKAGPLIQEKVFRAGAYAIDVSPPTLPVVVNGGFLQAQAAKVNDHLYARCLVLDDGSSRLAIVVVDSCMMPGDLIDRAKELTRVKTGIATDRLLISATHTHSAPSAMAALGSEADMEYVKFLPGRIAEGIDLAARNLAPARIGWSSINDFEHTHCRRWIRRPDRMLADPFGDLTVRANMHPGHLNLDTIAPSGPVDPGLSLLSVQTSSGRPIAVLANYSMHYFGASPVSADYYGLFASKLSSLVGETRSDPSFVAIMSQGTSGDQQWMDYGSPKPSIDIDAYANAVANRAFEAYKSIVYRNWVPLRMAESTLTLGRRVPDEKRLSWAREVSAKRVGPVPRSVVEVYAREAIELHDHPIRSLKIQAIRIGDLGIAAIPNEVYAITGLKIKAWSPFASTFTIELANGSEGYIPPPEQHYLGGYTTWPARTAALEVQAEPKIVDTVVGLLESVAGKPRRELNEIHGSYARSLLEAKPLVYWRLGEIVGPRSHDSSGFGNHGTFEDGVAYYLEGTPSPQFSGEGVINRSPHFAGGRLKADLKTLGANSSVALWFWNGMPNDARTVTGVLLSRGDDTAKGEELFLGGSRMAPGRLVFSGGGIKSIDHAGKTEIAPKTWHHVALVREMAKFAVYLDGATQPEIAGQTELSDATQSTLLFVGGGRDGRTRFEGKIDEVAIYDRALSPSEISVQFKLSLPPR